MEQWCSLHVQSGVCMRTSLELELELEECSEGPTGGMVRLAGVRRQAWLPPELLQGEATMLAKPGKDHSNPSSYRSITVLSSIRKTV